jgi:hypothetical protein
LRLLQLPNNWNIEAAFLYTESNVVDYNYAGFMSVEKVQAALNDTNAATALNVFGAGKGINNPDTIRGLVVRPRNDGIAYVYGEDFKARGNLFDLPAGPIKLSIGGEYRRKGGRNVLVSRPERLWEPATLVYSELSLRSTALDPMATAMCAAFIVLVRSRRGFDVSGRAG